MLTLAWLYALVLGLVVLRDHRKTAQRVTIARRLRKIRS